MYQITPQNYSEANPPQILKVFTVLKMFIWKTMHDHHSVTIGIICNDNDKPQ